MKRVTIKDVAKAAGVSYATVSRAFSDSSEIGEETKQRVLKISEELGYSPNAVARSMVRRRTETLGIVVPSIQNPYMSEFTSFLEQKARKLGYGIMICNSFYDVEIEKEALQMLMAKQVDGVFIMPSGVESAALFQPFTDQVPTVFVGENVQDLPETYVGVDNYGGAKLGTEYLYSLGHKHILYLGCRRNSLTHERRVKGYIDACKSLHIKPEVLYSNFQRSSQQVGYMLAKHYFEKPLEHTAIFCATDTLAIGVMQAADEMNLRIPEDISLMGYDNIPFTQLPRISLTTVTQSVEALADAALELMMDRIEDEKTEYVHRVLKASLVERTSCKMIG